jgi:two-component system cell cycle response regulator
MKANAKVLIVDDDPTNVKLLAAKLGDSGYIHLKAYSGEEALRIARSEKPDLMLLDIMMPDLNGFEVAAQMKNSHETANIPIILVTALDGSDNKTKGLEAGADDFLNKPVNTAELKTRVKSLLRLKRYSDQLKTRAQAEGMVLTSFLSDETLLESSLPSILIVEDSPADAKLFKSLLNSLACNIWTAHSGEEALSICSNYRIDVMILDVLLPGRDGYEIVKQVKENGPTQSLQIIVVTALQDIESKIKAFEFGADDYLVKPVNFNEFRARVNSLLKKKAYYDQLRANLDAAVQSAITDRLTGTYNKGYFQHYLKNELMRAERHAFPVAMLMLDLDDFKLVNDRHGHLAGDKLLREIAEILRQNIRETDFLARFGGDEFVIVMPYTQKEEAFAIAERIRMVFDTHPIAVSDHASLSISMSMGVTDVAVGNDTLLDVIHKADKALYAAKFDGKNKVSGACSEGGREERCV